jgi:hypothetical protein
MLILGFWNPLSRIFFASFLYGAKTRYDEEAEAGFENRSGTYRVRSTLNIQ